MGLEGAGIAVDRGGRRVVAEVGFTLSPGEILVLRGPNGAGKSSLLRAVAGLTPLAAGRITLDGAAEVEARIERLVYAGHLDAIKPQLTVAENLAFWARLGGGDAGAALDRFGLSPIADRRAGICSAGQRRRLGLARLMLADRPLWLLDEPTVSLDAEATGLLASLLDTHAARGGMAMVATHVPLGPGPERVLTLAPPGPGSAADPFLEAWG